MFILELIHGDTQLLQIFDLVVMSRLLISTLLEVGKDDSFLAEHLLIREPKLLEMFLQETHQLNSILSVDQPVMEHSHVLVVPQLHYAEWLTTIFSGSRTQTLENFVDITKIEGVMRFLWCW